MRPATRLLLAFSILMLACVGLLARIHVRNLRESWPKEQARRCSLLCASLLRHRQQLGSYPHTLHDLVHGGMLTEQQYEGLKFQADPWSEHLEWQYHTPGDEHEIVLYSGQPAVASRGEDALYFLGFANGAIIETPAKHLSWHLKRTATQWIRP